MAVIMRFLICLVVCHAASSMTLQEALQRRSEAYLTYAHDYAQPSDYEPIAFAAVSLHPPVPVLHIVSPNPRPVYQSLASTLSKAYARPYNYAASANTILYARPDKYGGYSYYRKTSRPSLAKKKPARPVILRIHKYRVVRD